MLTQAQKNAQHVLFKAVDQLFDATPDDYIGGYYVNDDALVSPFDQIHDLLHINNYFTKAVNEPKDKYDSDTYDALKRLYNNLTKKAHVYLQDSDYIDDEFVHINQQSFDYNTINAEKRYQTIANIANQAKDVVKAEEKVPNYLLFLMITPYTVVGLPLEHTVLKAVTWRDVANFFSYKDAHAWLDDQDFNK